MLKKSSLWDGHTSLHKLKERKGEKKRKDGMEYEKKLGQLEAKMTSKIAEIKKNGRKQRTSNLLRMDAHAKLMRASISQRRIESIFVETRSPECIPHSAQRASQLGS